MNIKRKLELLNSLELAIVPLEKYGVTGDHVCRATSKVLKSERELLLIDIQKHMILDIKSDRFEFEVIDHINNGGARIDAVSNCGTFSYEFLCEFKTADHDGEKYHDFVAVYEATIYDGAFTIDFSDVENELDEIIKNECETTLNLTNEPIY